MAKTKIDLNNVPKHIGIIMDGNRRWARKRGLAALEGHEAGVKALVKIIDHCLELGVETLTIYALSTENWRQRAKEEVKGLFGLLIRLVREKKQEYKKKGIKVGVLGDIEAFPHKVSFAIKEILSIVKTREKLKVNVCLNYGGRDEIVKAVQNIIEKKIPANKINEEEFAKHLYTNGSQDPDLMIRTGGEVRISNFLIWQLSYSELYFTPVLWPDFSPEELDKAIVEYQKRERRFGK
jgi:undecaprenyl diphosphate synthase